MQWSELGAGGGDESGRARRGESERDVPVGAGVTMQMGDNADGVNASAGGNAGQVSGGESTST